MHRISVLQIWPELGWAVAGPDLEEVYFTYMTDGFLWRQSNNTVNLNVQYLEKKNENF